MAFLSKSLWIRRQSEEAFPHFPSDFPFSQVSIMGLNVDSARLSDLMHSRASRFPLIYTSNCVLSLSIKLRTENASVDVDLDRFTSHHRRRRSGSSVKITFLMRSSILQQRRIGIANSRYLWTLAEKGNCAGCSSLLARQQPPQLNERWSRYAIFTFRDLIYALSRS